MGEEGRSHRGSTRLHAAHTNSHSFIHPLENADSEALTRWCGLRREEGRGSLRFPPVQVVRTSLTRPAETGGAGGSGSPGHHRDRGSVFSSLSTPRSQLSASACLPRGLGAPEGRSVGSLCSQPCVLANKTQDQLLGEQNPSTVENADGDLRCEQNTHDSSGKERVCQASYMVGRNVKLVWPRRRTVWRFLKNKKQPTDRATL